MKQKRTWKRHLPLLCGGLCLLVLLGTWLFINSRRNAGTYRLETIAGDPAVLAQYRIEAQLADALHTQEILVEGGLLTHRFHRAPVFGKQLSQLRLIQRQSYVEHPDGELQLPPEGEWRAAAYPGSGEVRKVVSTDTLQIALSLEEWEVQNQWARHSRGMDHRCTILTDVRIENDSPAFYLAYTRSNYFEEEPFSFRELMVQDPALERLYAQVMPHMVRTDAGELYVFPQITPACSGEAALYRVRQWGTPESYAPINTWPDGDTYFAQAWEQGRTEKLATLPLDGQGIQTLHLAEVGERLALLYTRQDVLMLRVYGKDGILLLEQALCEYSLPGYAPACNLDIQPAEQGVTLCYEVYGKGVNLPDSPPKNSASDHFAVSLRVDGAGLLSRCTTRQDQTTVQAAYLGGSWVMLLDDRADFADAAYNNGAGSVPRAQHMATLQLLDSKGKPLYIGGLYTDAAQDQLQFLRPYQSDATLDYARMLAYSGTRTLTAAEGGISRR